MLRMDFQKMKSMVSTDEARKLRKEGSFLVQFAGKV